MINRFSGTSILFLLLVQGMLFAQDLGKIDSVELNKKVKEFLADDKNWEDENRKALALEVDRNSIALAIENEKLYVRYESKKKNLSAEEKKSLEAKIDSLVVRSILGDKGGLANSELFKKIFDEKRIVFEPANQSKPIPTKSSKPEIAAIRKKLGDFMGDPDNKSVASEFGKSARLDFDGIEYDQAGNLVVPFMEADGVTMNPQDVENLRKFIKSKIMPALSNYGKNSLYDQAGYGEMLAGLKLPLQSGSTAGSGAGSSAKACPYSDEALAKAIKALKVRNNETALKLAEYVLGCESANVVAWKVKAMALYELNREKEARVAAERAQQIIERQQVDSANVARDLEPVQGSLREYLDDVRLSYLFFKPKS